MTLWDAGKRIKDGFGSALDSVGEAVSKGYDTLANATGSFLSGEYSEEEAEKWMASYEQNNQESASSENVYQVEVGADDEVDTASEVRWADRLPDNRVSDPIENIELDESIGISPFAGARNWLKQSIFAKEMYQQDIQMPFREDFHVENLNVIQNALAKMRDTVFMSGWGDDGVWGQEAKATLKYSIDGMDRIVSLKSSKDELLEDFYRGPQDDSSVRRLINARINDLLAKGEIEVTSEFEERYKKIFGGIDIPQNRLDFENSEAVRSRISYGNRRLFSDVQLATVEGRKLNEDTLNSMLTSGGELYRQRRAKEEVHETNRLRKEREELTENQRSGWVHKTLGSREYLGRMEELETRSEAIGKETAYKKEYDYYMEQSNESVLEVVFNLATISRSLAKAGSKVVERFMMAGNVGINLHNQMEKGNDLFHRLTKDDPEHDEIPLRVKMLASTYRVGLGAGAESAIDYVAGKIAEENTENSMVQNAFDYFVPKTLKAGVESYNVLDYIAIGLAWEFYKGEKAMRSNR